ncbi:MAG TPA: ribosomal protein S18-alanine N-acetyltransferase [Kofleriaceae bacterium]|jgi:ribosomal-protein-alanine N-acetyltransferase|nr:ribosomal protein S18-alanine N-acetyltransferase [Kofleriaceae bacterium]
MDLVITPATEADLDAIDEIEQHSFKSPWTRATFEGELKREWARIDVVRREHSARIIGFCNYWLVTTELHILAIATHPDVRGRRIATYLLGHILDKARAAGCSLATLEVRRSNRPAIALYERAGFKTVHVRARYYQDDGEDALVMLRGLSDDSATEPSP